MGKPYSEDLRRSVVQAIESGHTYEEVAELYGVSVSSVSRFLTRWRRPHPSTDIASFPDMDFAAPSGRSPVSPACASPARPRDLVGPCCDI